MFLSEALHSLAKHSQPDGHALYTDTNMKIRFYKQTTLPTAAFTQSSFYAHMLLHREVCTQRNFCTQTPLHTEAFGQTGFATQKRALRPNLPCCLNTCPFFLLPRPHHRPFASPFPIINEGGYILFFLWTLVIRTSRELVGETHLCLVFALDFSGIEEESPPPPTIKKAGSQEIGI